LIGSKAPLAINAKSSEYRNYRDKLISRFWNYKQARFAKEESLFEQGDNPQTRPPVFSKSEAGWNVLIAPDADLQKRRQVLEQLPKASRHRWFRSMTSTQALAQSIFGNLKAYDSVHFLKGLMDDQGLPLFDRAVLSAENVSMEHPVTTLNEPVPASIDIFLSGPYQVAIECALTEEDVGNCSAVTRAFCNGNYAVQMGRRERCYLTDKGLRYWECIPKVFSWGSNANHSPCPLHNTFQLVRRIFAASAGPDGKLSSKQGHAILIYDERNPAFRKGGKGFEAYESIRAALRYPTLLRKCSWQRLIKHMRSRSVLSWLTVELEKKYGL
jgi:hypothetical protein